MVRTGPGEGHRVLGAVGDSFCCAVGNPVEAKVAPPSSCPNQVEWS